MFGLYKRMECVFFELRTEVLCTHRMSVSLQSDLTCITLYSRFYIRYYKFHGVQEALRPK